jgi:hypothetical protein
MTPDFFGDNLLSGSRERNPSPPEENILDREFEAEGAQFSRRRSSKTWSWMERTIRRRPASRSSCREQSGGFAAVHSEGVCIGPDAGSLPPPEIYKWVTIP